MSLKSKIVLFLFIVAVAYGMDSYWTFVAQPTTSAHVAVQQLANTSYGAESTRAMDAYQGTIHMSMILLVMGFGIIMFGDEVVSAISRAIKKQGDKE